MTGQNEQQNDQSKQQMSKDNPNADPNWEPGKTGAVIDPENDGCPKENREAGHTKGTTLHSEQAPHVDQDNSGSVNNEGNMPLASKEERELLDARKPQDRDNDLKGEQGLDEMRKQDDDQG